MSPHSLGVGRWALGVGRWACYVMPAKLNSKAIEALVNALIRQERKLQGEHSKSLTQGHGKEMADHQRFRLAADIKFCFCDSKARAT
jgi:IS30 family transposase